MTKNMGMLVINEDTLDVSIYFVICYSPKLLLRYISVCIYTLKAF